MNCLIYYASQYSQVVYLTIETNIFTLKPHICSVVLLDEKLLPMLICWLKLFVDWL